MGKLVDMALHAAIAAQVKGWFESDMKAEYYFGYFGTCRVEEAAHNMADRICELLGEYERAKEKEPHGN